MNGRQVLIVNLSEDQKSVLGFASWVQVEFTAVGIIVGGILYSLVHAWLKSIGVPTVFSVGIGIFLFACCVAPLAYIAFYPIRDDEGHLLYYMNKQLMINYDFERKELGTYINIQENHHIVNRRFSEGEEEMQ